MLNSSLVSLGLLLGLSQTVLSAERVITIPESSSRLLEELKWADLKLDPDSGFCPAKFSLEKDDTANTQIIFKDFKADTTDLNSAYLRCRLAASVLVPKGYKIKDSIELVAHLKGELKGAGDIATGRLKFGIGQKSNRDFKLLEYIAPSDADEAKPQAFEMELKAKIPSTKTSCSDDTELSLSLFIESTVNGHSAQSSIISLQLPALVLQPLDCPAASPADN